MARGRMINQKIAEDIDFNEMSIDAQFLFMRAIPFLDRDGLIWGHPALLASKIAPLLPQFGAVISSVIDEWIQFGFVIKYMDGKTPVLFFKGFFKNQSLTHYDRESPSTFAPPPCFFRTPKGLKPTDSDNSTPTPEPEKTSKALPKSQEGASPELVRTPSGASPELVHLNGSLNRSLKETTTTTPAREAEPVVEKPNSGGGGGFPNTRHRQSDQEYARLCQKFESEGFGTLTQILAEEINALMNEYPTDWIDDAMTVSVEANKRQLRYTRGILVRWRAQGRNDKRTIPGQAPPVKEVLPFKKWCLDKYNTTNAEYIPGIPEALIHEQYEQYRKQYQQAH